MTEIIIILETLRAANARIDAALASAPRGVWDAANIGDHIADEEAEINRLHQRLLDLGWVIPE